MESVLIVDECYWEEGLLGRLPSAGFDTFVCRCYTPSMLLTTAAS